MWKIYILNITSILGLAFAMHLHGIPKRPVVYMMKLLMKWKAGLTES